MTAKEFLTKEIVNALQLALGKYDTFDTMRAFNEIIIEEANVIKRAQELKLEERRSAGYGNYENIVL